MPWRELLWIEPARDRSEQAVRREQLTEMLRLLPASQLFSALTALLVASQLHRRVDAMALYSWVAAVFAVIAVRMIRCRRIVRRIGNPAVVDGMRSELALTAVVVALLWIAPAFLWSTQLDVNEQIVLGMVLLGLMCSGGASLAMVPPAALAFVVLIGIGQIRMTFFHHSWAVTLLSCAMPVVLCQASFASARLFIRRVRARRELEEQGQLIRLLREFQSSGSEWLWELDAALNIEHVSDEMAAAIGVPARAARHDPLTGLGNRLFVREMIEEARLRQLKSNGDCTLFLLDLDRFKMVNDTLGHAVGDHLLIEIARRLERVCGAQAGIGRLGGDEFAIVWRGALDMLSLLDLAERVTEAIQHDFMIGPSPVLIGVSIGSARAPIDGESEEQLMRSADLALYRAKEQGRGRSSFFEPWMLAKAQAERLFENDVREAVRRGDLHLHYQPIVASASLDPVGYEALLRWSHSTRGEIAPDVFVPIIEDVGLIHQIGDWVIREACAQAVKWPGTQRIAVNISVAQLTGAGLRRIVDEALRDSGLAPDRLELEVTETIFLGDDAETLGALASLQALGVRLVLDDFGKGYSSFGYLSRACFSKIKIDQLFVRGAAAGQRDCLAIVKSILALASGLGVETTAEGVETLRQAEQMIHLGCSQLQGYLFGKPTAADEIVRELLATPFFDQPPQRRRG